MAPKLVHAGLYKLPPLPAPEHYGNMTLDRVASKKGVLPVTFSHWSHRREYTCDVCHMELEFSMELGSSEIDHSEQQKGLYCGACHDGKLAFTHKDNCYTCHNPDPKIYRRRYMTYFNSKPFVPTEFGNQIDWVQALQRGQISPRRFLKEESLSMNMDRDLELSAERAGVSAAGFPHKPHLDWMSCNICHPEIFMIQRNGTENMNMTEIADGKFCGVCHLNVAFPLDNCNRCHPDMRSR